MYSSSNKEENDAGLILIGLEGQKVEYVLCQQFPVTNNIVEYEALILSLKLAREVSVQIVKVFSDSQLIVKQVNETYKARGQLMEKYLLKANKVI